jgi:hypothetical protein
VPSIPFSGAFVTRSTDQAVGNDDFDAVSFDTELYDTDDYWDIGSPTVFTIPADGYYAAGGSLNWDSAANGTAGVRGANVFLNGTDNVANLEWPTSGLTGAEAWQSVSSGPLPLTMGDTLQFVAYQFNVAAASVDVMASNDWYPSFWIVRLG